MSYASHHRAAWPWGHPRSAEGIVKLWGLMPSPDSRGRMLGSMLTDPALRPPALSL